VIAAMQWAIARDLSGSQRSTAGTPALNQEKNMARLLGAFDMRRRVSGDRHQRRYLASISGA
jgi:hypothetical protein